MLVRGSKKKNAPTKKGDANVSGFGGTEGDSVDGDSSNMGFATAIATTKSS